MRAVPAFPLVVLWTLTCRLGLIKGFTFEQSYPWRHQWVRWFGPGPWAPPQVFFSDLPQFVFGLRLPPGLGVFA